MCECVSLVCPIRSRVMITSYNLFFVTCILWLRNLLSVEMHSQVFVRSSFQVFFINFLNVLYVIDGYVMSSRLLPFIIIHKYFSTGYNKASNTNTKFIYKQKVNNRNLEKQMRPQQKGSFECKFLYTALGIFMVNHITIITKNKIWQTEN